MVQEIRQLGVTLDHLFMGGKQVGVILGGILFVGRACWVIRMTLQVLEKVLKDYGLPSLGV